MMMENDILILETNLEGLTQIKWFADAPSYQWYIYEKFYLFKNNNKGTKLSLKFEHKHKLD